MSTADDRIAVLQQAIVQLAKNSAALRSDVDRLARTIDEMPCAKVCSPECDRKAEDNPDMPPPP